MKNKVILLLVAVVVLASLALVGCGEVPPAMGFVSPGKTVYYVGETLDLTGGKVYGDQMADVALTTSMLDASSYDMATAGNYTVKGSYQGFDFSFAITVNALPASTAFVSPAQTSYYVGDTLNLAGASVTIDATNHDITADMLDATSYDMATAGNYTVTGSCNGVAFSFSITVASLPTSDTAFVSPAKKVYALGASKINLVGATVTVGDTTVDVTEDMLNASTLPNFNQVGNYTVTGSHKGYEFAWQVSVYSPFEFKHDTDFVFTRAADVSKHVWIRETYEDGTQSDWYNVTSNDFSVFELSADKLHVELDMYVNNYAYNYAADFAFNDVQGISVSEFKQGTVGQQYFVNGIVVAITSTVTRVEVILADKVTGEVVSASNLTAGGAFFSNTLKYDFAIGDEITVPLVLRVANNVGIEGDTTAPSGDCEKLWGEYTGGDQLATAILTSGNTAPINYDNAVEVTSQAQLKSLLGATNRQDNIYKVVHLKGEMKFIWYSNASQLRFWFADGNISSYSSQKIDSVSPVFCEYTQGYTTGATFRDMLLGSTYTHTTWATAPSYYVDIYALFIGGNNYYHKFVILRNEDAKPMEATVTNRTFTPPTVLNYTLGSTLNLTGAKITTSYDIKADEVVDVTADMIDATSYDMTTAGNYTVKGNYNGYQFSFDIVVSNKIVTSIAVETNPTKTTYTHRDNLSTLDLTGGKVRVNYSTGESEVVDLERSMLPAEDTNWAVGVVNYTVDYYGCQTTLAITYNNTALTVSQLLANTPEELNTATNTYELTGVVVGPVSSYYGSEILVKEKGTNKVVGIVDKEGGVAGKYNGINLDTTKLNVGDEIAITVIFETWTDKTATNCVGGADHRYIVRPTTKDFATSDLKILSKGNSVAINLTDADVTVIDSQEDLAAFLTSPTRTYTYVKFVGANYARHSTSSANFNLFFGATTADGAKINGAPARISTVNANYYLTKDFASTTYMSNTKSTSYSSPANFKCDFYALCLGGNYAAHHFTILQDNWMLTA